MESSEESNIERHHRIGQTSEQLADRNSVWRVLFYGALGAIAGGTLVNFIAPAFVIPAVFVGLLSGVGVAVAIEEKTKRVDLAKKSRAKIDQENARERETLEKIEVAKANGDFDRWKKDE